MMESSSIAEFKHIVMKMCMTLLFLRNLEHEDYKRHLFIFRQSLFFLIDHFNIDPSVFTSISPVTDKQEQFEIYKKFIHYCDENFSE